MTAPDSDATGGGGPPQNELRKAKAEAIDLPGCGGKRAGAGENGDSCKVTGRGEGGVEKAAADSLHDRILLFVKQAAILLTQVRMDRGTTFDGAPKRHEYELYLAVEHIAHTRTKTKNLQPNGIVERVHKTLLHECSPVTVCKKLSHILEALQAD